MREARAATILWQPDGVRIPTSLTDLGTFRRWARSGAFPEKGRIDWVAGGVEVDMSPEDLNTHGTPKGGLQRDISTLIESSDRGFVLTDSSRLSSRPADLSAEPDIVAVLFESVESGRVKLVQKSNAEQGRYVEIEGAADLVVECLSDSSEDKDTRRLKEAYARAGVREYWLVDARVAPPLLTIFRLAGKSYREVSARADGFRPSVVLGVAVRLVRRPPRADVVRYRLETRPL